MKIQLLSLIRTPIPFFGVAMKNHTLSDAMTAYEHHYVNNFTITRTNGKWNIYLQHDNDIRSVLVDARSKSIPRQFANIETAIRVLEEIGFSIHSITQKK